MVCVDENIKCLVNYINEAKGDSLKMRNISNFYDRYKSKKYQNDEKIVEKLYLYSKGIKNGRDLNMFKILPFVLSDRDNKHLPEPISPIVDYKIGNMPIDLDLAKCNIYVYKDEFN